MRHVPFKEIDYSAADLEDLKFDKSDGAMVHGRKIKNLGNIERVLCRHVALKEVGVAPRYSGRQRILWAFCLMEEGHDLTTKVIQELKAICENSLPGYCRPSRYRRVVKLPHREDGRIDHKALKALTNGGISKLQKGVSKKAVQREERDFGDQEATIELLDPVNIVHFEGAYAKLKTLKLWGIDSVTFDLKHRYGDRKTTGRFWTDSQKMIQALEELQIGAHVKVEGRIRTLVTGMAARGLSTLIECISFEEVDKIERVPLEDIDGVLKAAV